jgi:hypothetical protein
VLLGGERDAVQQVAEGAFDVGGDAAQPLLGGELALGRLLDRSFEASAPDREVDGRCQADDVVAVALRRHGAADGVVPPADQGVVEAEGHVREVLLLRQLHHRRRLGHPGALPGDLWASGERQPRETREGQLRDRRLLRQSERR